MRGAGTGNTGKKPKTAQAPEAGGRVVTDQVSAARGVNVPSRLAGLVRSDLDSEGARSVGNSVKKGLAESSHHITNANPDRLSTLQS